MAIARRLLVDPTRSGVFHCVSRCVRRAFLCGRDTYSGRDYEHRRGWIRDRLRELAGLFAVEVHSYSVMSNHLHVVVRTLPRQVEGWDDEADESDGVFRRRTYFENQDAWVACLVASA